MAFCILSLGLRREVSGHIYVLAAPGDNWKEAVWAVQPVLDLRRRGQWFPLGKLFLSLLSAEVESNCFTSGT